MNSELENLLFDWPLPVIRDVDISILIFDNAPKRYALVNRALKKGNLVRLRRGTYLIGKPFRKTLPSQFEISHTIYGPGYISFESSLVYHQWIPEAVYTTTSATAKRTVRFDTPIGVFQYEHVPQHLYYLGVQRVENNDQAFYMAEPWKAIADHYYAHKRNWKNIKDLCTDMRIEIDDLFESDLTLLKTLSENYQCNRVRKFLTTILKDLLNGNKNN